MSSKVKQRSRDRPLRILVVDEGFIGSLHTAIALSDMGCDVLLAAAVGGAFEYRRASFRSVACPPPSHEDFLAHIRTLHSTNVFDVVYPATEPVLLALLCEPDIAPRIFPRIDALQLDCIRDKQVMLDVAARACVRVPETQTRTSAFPAVVKAERGRGGDAVFIVANAREAERAHDAIRRMGRQPVVQQYIDGPTWLVGGVFDRGTAVRLYAGRKLRQQPPRTGPASVIASESNPALLDAAQTVMRALEWTGLASCDFVQSADGAFHFLELNPRPWGSIAAAADAGVDLFGPLLTLMEGGTPAIDVRFTAGVRTEVFPLYLLDWKYRLDPRTLLRIGRDLGRHPLWRRPHFLRHMIDRLLRVRANWPSLRS